MAQRVECLSCNYKDLRFDLQNTHKSGCGSGIIHLNPCAPEERWEELVQGTW